jgi:Domain of unknown function (DUF4956)
MRVTIGVLSTFVAILLLTGALAYFLRDQPTERRVSTPTPTGSPRPGASPSPTAAASPESLPVFGEIFAPEETTPHTPLTYASWPAIVSQIALKFALAAFLAALLAFRPRRGLKASRRNPYVAQTQILMAVVAGAMMMVVGDSAARAFGIFAAASLVRFRTNIRDPKEITVLLICLGVGLAAGVGRWDMAIILTLFVLVALYALEYFEQSQVFRSMEVTVETRNVDTTNDVLKRLFGRHRFDAELKELNRHDEEDVLGKIVYLVNLSPRVSTNKLSEEIFAGDKENIDSVEWDQKESLTYIYK